MAASGTFETSLGRNTPGSRAAIGYVAFAPFKKSMASGGGLSPAPNPTAELVDFICNPEG
jgi:hypothetical protein